LISHYLASISALQTPQSIMFKIVALLLVLAALILTSFSVEAAGFGDACKASKPCLETIDDTAGFDLCSVSNGIISSCATTSFETCETSCNATMYDLIKFNEAFVSNITDMNYVCIEAASRENVDALCDTADSTNSAAGRAGSYVLFVVAVIAAFVAV